MSTFFHIIINYVCKVSKMMTEEEERARWLFATEEVRLVLRRVDSLPIPLT
jgi:hypothetical protein